MFHAIEFRTMAWLGAVVLASWSMAIAEVPAEKPSVTPAMRERAIISRGDPARLDAVLAKARRGEPICVAAIGGSITAGGRQTKDPKRRYVAQLARWFEATFPGLKVRFVNAGIGSTNSGYGALRVQRDVLAQHPDLVVVEFAVNDSGAMADSYEGVLRQLLSSSTNLAVIELFFMHKDGASAQPEQVRLGRHYGLPMISFRDAVWPELQAGALKWETIYDDVVHPNDAGHDVASELLRGFLDGALAELPAADQLLPAVPPIPAPLISDAYERCCLLRAADLHPTAGEGWTCVRSNFWEFSGTDGRLDFQAPGTMLLMGRDIPTAASNAVTLVVNGGKPVPIRNDGHNRTVVTDLPQGQHSVSILIHSVPSDEKHGAGKVRIAWVGSAGVPPACSPPVGPSATTEDAIKQIVTRLGFPAATVSVGKVESVKMITIGPDGLSSNLAGAEAGAKAADVFRQVLSGTGSNLSVTVTNLAMGGGHVTDVDAATITAEVSKALKAAGLTNARVTQEVQKALEQALKQQAGGKARQ